MTAKGQCCPIGTATNGQLSPLAGLIWYGERIRPADKKVPQLSANTRHSLIAFAILPELYGIEMVYTMQTDNFDWHSDQITNSTPVTKTYKNTQNVRRYLKNTCGPDFKFNREFMAWIKNGKSKTMGEVASEWLRRNESK